MTHAYTESMQPILPYLRKSGSLCQLTLLSVGLWFLCLPVAAQGNPELQPEAPAEAQAAKSSPLEEGVKAYRDGDYRQARKVFDNLHKQAPENTRATYYLAITEAQLGRFQQAKRLYNEVITLEPHGETAALAKEGLKYLPSEASLDLPPRFNQPATTAGQTPSTATPVGAQPNNQSATTNLTSGMSPQDLMAWQMLMGQSNGNSMNNNPMNAIMPGMIPGMNPGMTGSPNGGQNFDPAMMSNTLMNQMLQNINLGGEPNDNR